MKNIELFDEYAARIFVELYQSFPVKIFVDARKLCGHEEIDDFGRILDGRGEPSKPFEIAHATIAWLKDTGYVRGEDMHAWGLSQAVLSPMGLAVLKSVPSSLKVSETTGDRLAKLVRDGSYDGAKDLVKSAIAAGSAMLMGVVGISQ